MDKNLINKFLKFAVGPIGAAAIGFILVPITTWMVSPEQFGLTTMFTLVQTLISAVVFIGIDEAYIREYNVYKGKQQTLLFSAAIIPITVSVILMFVTIVFTNEISIYLFGEINKLVMGTLAIWIPFIVVERFLLLDIRMQEKGLQYSLFSILIKVSTMILTIILLLSFSRTYTSVVLGAMAGQIIADIVIFLYLGKVFNFKKVEIDKEVTKKMLKFGAPILPALIITWVLNSTDRVVLDYYSTVDNIGIYFAAMKLVTVVSLIQSIFATFWLPIAYRWHEEKVPTQNFVKVSYILTICMGILFIGLLFVKELAVWILSPDYAQAQYILPFLLFMPVMFVMSETTVLGISFARKTYWHIWISIIAAIVNIILNIALVPYIGAIGAAMGTGFAYVTFFWVRTFISQKYWYKMNLSFYLINTIMLLVIASLNVIVRSNNIYFINIVALIVFCLINMIFVSKVFDLKMFKNKINSIKNK